MTDYRDILKKIGMNFRLERVRKKLSQEQFAELANVHTNYIGKIERGEQNLTIRKIVEVSDALEIPVNKVFNFEQ